LFELSGIGGGGEDGGSGETVD